MKLPDEQKQEILARQLEVSIGLWQRLQHCGVDANTPLSLDFFFDAPSRQAAVRLVALLQTETDYQVCTHAVGIIWRRWDVIGLTPPLPLDQEVLADWVRYMVQAGARCGCVLDGWGAHAPETT